MKLVIFAGTSEGRDLCTRLSQAGREAMVCVATEYGKEVLPPMPGITVHTGRMTAEEMADLQPEVCREPALALYGGLDGLDFYRRIAREAPDYLLPGGWLLLEIGSAQAEAVSALLAERFEALAVYPDMQGLPRAVAARLRECARV